MIKPGYSTDGLPVEWHDLYARAYAFCAHYGDIQGLLDEEPSATFLLLTDLGAQIDDLKEGETDDPALIERTQLLAEIAVYERVVYLQGEEAYHAQEIADTPTLTGPQLVDHFTEWMPRRRQIEEALAQLPNESLARAMVAVSVEQLADPAAQIALNALDAALRSKVRPDEQHRLILHAHRAIVQRGIEEGVE